MPNSTSAMIYKTLYNHRQNHTGLIKKKRLLEEGDTGKGMSMV